MKQFSLVYNNLFVFLEPVDEPRPTYAVPSTIVVVLLSLSLTSIDEPSFPKALWNIWRA